MQKGCEEWRASTLWPAVTSTLRNVPSSWALALSLQALLPAQPLLHSWHQGWQSVFQYLRSGEREERRNSVHQEVNTVVHRDQEGGQQQAVPTYPERSGARPKRKARPSRLLASYLFLSIEFRRYLSALPVTATWLRRSPSPLCRYGSSWRSLSYFSWCAVGGSPSRPLFGWNF